MITFKEFSTEKIEEVKEIYKEAGWTAYLVDENSLQVAFKNSLYLLGAYDKVNLVGFVRCLGDGEHFVIVQDLIVKKEYQGKKIGRKLLSLAQEKFKHVRTFILITDLEDNKSNSFYKNFGLRNLEELGLISYIR